MKRTGFALALSLLLHLAIFASPGWRLPITESSVSLEANLLAAAPRPVGPQRPMQKAPALSDATAPSQGGAEPQQAVPPEAQTALPVAPVVPSPAPAPPVAVAPSPEPALSPEPQLPRHGRIRFAVMRGDQGFVVGQSVHRWSHDGKAYVIESVTETTGLAALFRPARVTQTSEGEITAEGLKPHEYRTKRNDVATEAARFDWQAQKLRFSGERNAPLSPGSQDMLSLFYQLGQQVVHERKELPIATGKKYENYVFAALGEEKLSTRFGVRRVWHLRTGGEPGGETTEVWLDLDVRGLPLKIRYTDRNGESFDQVAEEIELDNNESAEGANLPNKLPETGR